MFDLSKEEVKLKSISWFTARHREGGRGVTWAWLIYPAMAKTRTPYCHGALQPWKASGDHLGITLKVGVPFCTDGIDL